MDALALKILILRWIFFFDVFYLVIILIALFFSGFKIRQALKQFIAIILIETFSLYMFLGVPIGCSLRILYKTPVASTYYFLGEVIESEGLPKAVKNGVVKPVRFIFATLLSSQQASKIDELRKKNVHLFYIIDKQIFYELLRCFIKRE